ncbi:TPA: IS66 family transposase [Escherichia coli]|nr:IS66 family transposase [Escherichia coli]
MTDDILHTIQNPDELRRLATELLTAQAREYEQRLHNLNTVNSTLEQRIHDLHAAMQAEKTAYEQRIRELEEALKLAQQWRFGRKSERLPAGQKPLADEDAASDEADITRQLRDLLPPEEKTGKKPVRQPLPAHLPREETVLAPGTGPGDGHPCPGCGAAMRHIRDEVNEVLEYVPAHFVVKRTVRPQYGCPDCDTVHSAALPAAIIDKGQAGPGLLAQVVIAKVLDHLPLQRQQKIYAREGVQLPVSTLADWFGQTAAALKRDLLTQPVLQADETPLQILDTQKGKAKKGYLWAYVSAAGSVRDIVVYDCRSGRGGEYARAMLAGWSGTLVVDGYAGYSALFRGGQEGEPPEPSGIREAGCLAHVRRKFMDLYRMNGSPGAREALEQIRALYILERTIRSRPAEQKRRWRRRYARPRMEAFHAWLSAGEKTSAPGGALHGAITYALKRWAALTTYLDDGRVPLDNNRCEQMMRPVAQGRKSWLFAGSLRGGERMAELLTLLHTARLNGLEPVAWLRDVLEKLPSWPASRLDELLPYRRQAD